MNRGKNDRQTDQQTDRERDGERKRERGGGACWKPIIVKVIYIVDSAD